MGRNQNVLRACHQRLLQALDTVFKELLAQLPLMPAVDMLMETMLDFVASLPAELLAY